MLQRNNLGRNCLLPIGAAKYGSFAGNMVISGPPIPQTGCRPEINPGGRSSPQEFSSLRRNALPVRA
jgi:hypothetical protein